MPTSCQTPQLIAVTTPLRLSAKASRKALAAA